MKGKERAVSPYERVEPLAIPATIRQLSHTIWELPTSHKPGMRVPARIYATPALLESMDDGVFDQITNVATLPEFGITMPEQVVVVFHCGSRGFGHQVATDYLQTPSEA